MRNESYSMELPRKHENLNLYRIPKLYKDAARIVDKYCKKEGSIQTLIYETKHRSNMKRLYATVSKVVDRYSDIENALNVVKLFEEQPKFDRGLAFVLTSEILRKDGALPGNCKPVEVINSYEEELRKILKNNICIFKETNSNKEFLPKYVRINTHQLSEKEAHVELRELGWKLLDYKIQETTYYDFLNFLKDMGDSTYMKDYHIPNLLIFSPHQEFWQTDLYKNCCILLQDKASCLPAFLSNVQPGDTVIDACASPGNKTSHLADIMDGKGRLIAIDKDRKRFNTMTKLLSERGMSWVETINCDFTSCNPTDYEDAKVILVDPSCSSSGTNFHEDEISKERVLRLAAFQLKILHHALSFPNVKTVVYSTCSIHEEENEQVVEKALDNYSTLFHLEDLSNSLSGWKHFGSSKYEFGHLCIRTDSSIDKCQGFFVAKFVRIKSKNESKKRKKAKCIKELECKSHENKKIKR